MSIESTTEYKQDRINVRNINAIILTGRCYMFKGIYYELEENDDRILKGEVFKELENVRTVCYKNILTGGKFIRLTTDFFFKFIKVEQQLL